MTAKMNGNEIVVPVPCTFKRKNEMSHAFNLTCILKSYNYVYINLRRLLNIRVLSDSAHFDRRAL